MGKAKSQWDFGELFPVEATRRVLTVAELTGTIRRLLEREVGTIWVTGEVTNLRAQASGHVYFTLKDASAQLPCVLFRSEATEHRDALCDGQKLVLQGDITVYEPRGQYQLRVLAIELKGIGALQLAFERLKQRLQAEGLFAAERKRPLPSYPQRIGLVTSPTGAAIRDVLHVAQRRHPGLKIILVPCRVQGQGAAEEIAAATRLLNDWSATQPPTSRLDLILLTRGGGSLEDLWAFNEEIVARAVFNSVLPVVSAVGHEIDFTISDFVADVRAATPSAAAEIITEDVFRSCEFVAEVCDKMRCLVRLRVEAESDRADHLARRLERLHPRRLLNERLQYLDDLQTALVRSTRQNWRLHRTNWMNLRQRLSRLKPSALISQRRQEITELRRQFRLSVRRQIESRRGAFVTLEARLRLLSPDNVLSRGYSITTDATTGQVLRNAASVRPGQPIKTRLQIGEIRSRAEE